MAVIDGVDLDALDYVVYVPYNGSGAMGGDSLTENLNIWYEVWIQLASPVWSVWSWRSQTAR